MTSGQENPERRVRTQRVFVRSDAVQLAELVNRVDAGQLHIDVADRRPLTEAAAVPTTPTPIACQARPFSSPGLCDPTLIG